MQGLDGSVLRLGGSVARAGVAMLAEEGEVSKKKRIYKFFEGLNKNIKF
jgi:hypothetical protein